MERDKVIRMRERGREVEREREGGRESIKSGGSGSRNKLAQLQ